MDYNNGEGSNLENTNEMNSNDSLNENSNNFNNSYDSNDYNNSYNNNDFNNNANFNNNFNNTDYETPNPNNGFAIASLVLGILSIPLACCYGFGLVTAVISIIFGIISRRHNGGKLSGMAIAGIICSVLGVLASIIMIISLVYAFSTMDSSTYQDLIRALEGDSNFY